MGLDLDLEVVRPAFEVAVGLAVDRAVVGERQRCRNLVVVWLGGATACGLLEAIEGGQELAPAQEIDDHPSGPTHR